MKNASRSMVCFSLISCTLTAFHTKALFSRAESAEFETLRSFFYHLYAQTPAAFSTERLQEDDNYRNDDKSHQSFPEMRHILFFNGTCSYSAPISICIHVFTEMYIMYNENCELLNYISRMFFSMCVEEKKLQGVHN